MVRPTTLQINVGDSLANIANEVMGDYSQWRELAEMNDLDIFKAIEIGRTIKIPTAKEVENSLKKAVTNEVDKVLKDLDLTSLTKSVVDSIGEKEWRTISWVL
ncbi:LysM peptidoglycan-binding domain-containing protein [Calothrix membranacea FACHB-236]|nr:LysM peptidoglycan-binding domain-containing protein [Calothrix membranacea FACHB-236]